VVEGLGIIIDRRSKVRLVEGTIKP